MLTKVHLEFVSAIKAAAIVDDNHDCCKRTNNSFHVCNTCYSMIVEKSIPKFGSANCINVLPCQKYSDVFSDLTPIKKTFIACIYSVIFVIKLRPSITDSTTSYYRIQGLTVVLLQNPRPLLTILLLNNLAPYNVICIAWANKYSHTASDICLFATVQRTRVLEILYWLKANNSLYKDIVINLNLLYICENEFVPVHIANNVL